MNNVKQEKIDVSKYYGQNLIMQIKERRNLYLQESTHHNLNRPM